MKLRPRATTAAQIAKVSLASNGQIADATAPYQAADGLNHVMAYKRKQVFTLGTGFSDDVFYFAFEAGPAPTSARLKLRAEAIISPIRESTTDPRFWLTLNGVDSEVAHTQADDSVSAVDLFLTPDRWTEQTIEVDISPGTTYYCSLNLADSIIIHSIVIYEVVIPSFQDTDSSVFSSSKFSRGQVITDYAYDQIATRMDNLYSQQSVPLLGYFWGSTLGSPLFTTTSGVYANPIDGSKTVTSGTAGWRVQLENRDPLHGHGYVNARIYIRTGDWKNGNKFRLSSQDQGVLYELTGNSSNANTWITDTFRMSTLSGTMHKIDPQMLDNAAGTPEIFTVQVYLED